jgi:hypothetical protein
MPIKEKFDGTAIAAVNSGIGSKQIKWEPPNAVQLAKMLQGIEQSLADTLERLTDLFVEHGIRIECGDYFSLIAILKALGHSFPTKDGEVSRDYIHSLLKKLRVTDDHIIWWNGCADSGECYVSETTILTLLRSPALPFLSPHPQWLTERLAVWFEAFDDDLLS